VAAHKNNNNNRCSVHSNANPKKWNKIYKKKPSGIVSQLLSSLKDSTKKCLASVARQLNDEKCAVPLAGDYLNRENNKDMPSRASSRGGGGSERDSRPSHTDKKMRFPP
jgi:hypothetical protein